MMMWIPVKDVPDLDIDAPARSECLTLYVDEHPAVMGRASGLQRISRPSEKPTRTLAWLAPCCRVVQNCCPPGSPARCNTFWWS
jgi:hypothetical protein